jgi:hypothetical protein
LRELLPISIAQTISASAAITNLLLGFQLLL